MKIVFILLSVYIVFVVLLYLFQSKLIFLPYKTLVTTPKAIGLDYESVEFKADDGTKLHGWFIPSKNSKTTLLFFHGNAGNISHRLDSIEIFNSLGLNVFIVDYRGYGNSEGNINEQNSYDDAKVAWDYLRKTRVIEAKDIILFGRSLGAAIAAHLGGNVEPKAVILESSFSSIRKMAAQIYPFVPSFLVRYNFDTAQHVKKISSPILIIHSKDDDIVPFSHGKTIYKNANQPKTFLEIRGNHNSGFLQSRDIYLPALKDFIQNAK